MTWQTDLKDWVPFPWSCDNMRPEDQTPNAVDNETAYWCVFGHRLIESECLGMRCPYCKPHHTQEYIDNLGGTIC